jgi:hypothetical protein
MVPYLKRHFIYIGYAKLMYHVGSGKVTNIPSCVLQFIRDAMRKEFTEDGCFNFTATRVL